MDCNVSYFKNQEVKFISAEDHVPRYQQRRSRCDLLLSIRMDVRQDANLDVQSQGQVLMAPSASILSGRE